MKTAVEWLVDELNQKIDYIPLDKWDMIRDIVLQAKQMEREQHGDTWNNAINAVEKDKWESFEQYYKETFKSEE